jgi:hypothetical protein
MSLRMTALNEPGRIKIPKQAAFYRAIAVLVAARKALREAILQHSQHRPDRTFGANQRCPVRAPFEVLAMAHDRRRHPWVRRIAIAFALVAGYVLLGALTFQDSPNDPPIIVLLLSK